MSEQSPPQQLQDEQRVDRLRETSLMIAECHMVIVLSLFDSLIHPDDHPESYVWPLPESRAAEYIFGAGAYHMADSKVSIAAKSENILVLFRSPVWFLGHPNYQSILKFSASSLENHPSPYLNGQLRNPRNAHLLLPPEEVVGDMLRAVTTHRTELPKSPLLEKFISQTLAVSDVMSKLGSTDTALERPKE